jgi:hypothetical protein
MKLFMLSILLGITILTIAFDAQKCEHIFTAVEQPSINAVTFSYGDGKELVCVKCFHKQMQVINYGPAAIGNFSFDHCNCGPGLILRGDSNGALKWDTLNLK